MRRQIRAICMSCKQDFTGTKAVIHIPYAEVNRVEQLRREWDAKVDADPMNSGLPEGGGRFVSAGLLVEYPEGAAWLVHCNDCNPHGHGDGTMCGECYWVDVGTITTWPELIEFTCHMEEKLWFNATNWMDLLRGVAESNVTGLVASRWVTSRSAAPAGRRTRAADNQGAGR